MGRRQRRDHVAGAGALTVAGARFWRLLRSRRLAVGCFLAIGAFGILGTVAKGVYTTPLFLVLVAVTAASTAACAWERTGVARRMLASGSATGDAARARLHGSPTFAIPAGDVPDALARARAGLRASGLRVTERDGVLVGVAGRAGLVGSPLFHWSLVALMVVIAAGQLTRAEGLIGVPEGGGRIDRATSYRQETHGPLYAGHSGLRIAVGDIERDLVDAQGVARGAAPLVRLSDGGRVVAQGRVYPNAPLRHGSLLIHLSATGLYPTLAVESSAGVRFGSQALQVDFDPKRPAATLVSAMDVSGPAFGRVEVSVNALPPRESTRTATLDDIRLVVRVRRGAAPAAALVLRVGESIPLGAGYRLVYVSMRRYARLSVADDWSVTPMYVLFGTAVAGLVLALLVPYRSVRVAVAPGESGDELRGLVQVRRGSPSFAGDVEAAVRDALACHGEGGAR